MESKKTLACPVEEDSKTSKEESSKPENDQSELVVEGCKALTPFEFELSVTKESTDDTKLSKDIKDNQDKPRSNRPLYLKNQGFKRYKRSLAFRAFLMLVTIQGALGQCIGDGDVCLSLAQKGPDWFNKHPECLDVRCLNLSNGQHDLPPYFRDVQELYMGDMGNSTISCDVLKNWPNLHKIDLHVKNIFPTDACNTSCVLPEVTVAVLHNTTAITCNLTEWMPNLKSVSFKNDQAPTSVSTGIIPECVTTTAANMVNQEKDAGFSVSFKNDQAPTSVPTEITSEGVFTTPGNMVNQEKDAGFSVGVIIGVVAVVVLVIGVAFGVGIVVGILLHRNKNDKIKSRASSPTPVQDGVTKKMLDQCESESVV